LKKRTAVVKMQIISDQEHDHHCVMIWTKEQQKISLFFLTISQIRVISLITLVKKKTRDVSHYKQFQTQIIPEEQFVCCIFFLFAAAKVDNKMNSVKLWVTNFSSFANLPAFYSYSLVLLTSVFFFLVPSVLLCFTLFC
jgi:hypothetical protein